MKNDFETWQDHFELHERRNYPALVELCESEVAANPGALQAFDNLAEAYLLNGQYQEAIDLIGRAHAEHPEICSFAHTLLDALFAMGKSEDDFPWKRRPSVLRIGPEVADLCFEYLRPKRKPRSISELYEELEGPAYPAFTEQELLCFLRSEGRFEVVERRGLPLLKIDRENAEYCR